MEYVITLREFIDHRLAQLEQKIDMRFSAHEELHTLYARSQADATALIHSRINSLEEQLSGVSRAQGNFLSRELYDEKHSILEKEVATLREFKANYEGRFWMLGFVLTFVSIVSSVLMRLLAGQ